MVYILILYCLITYTYGFAVFDLENPSLGGIFLWFFSPILLPLIALVGLPLIGDNK